MRSVTPIKPCLCLLLLVVLFQLEPALHVQANGEDFRSEVTDEWATEVLRQTPGVVRLTVLRDESLVGFAQDKDLYEVFTLDLVKKPGKGLGFSIVSRLYDNGIYISDVVSSRALFFDSFFRRESASGLVSEMGLGVRGYLGDTPTGQRSTKRKPQILLRLCLVFTRRDGLSRKFFSGHGFTNPALYLHHIILTCCLSVTDRNWNGQNTGGALAVTKGLVGKFP